VTTGGRDYWPALLRSHRARHGLSQAALAAHLGVDQTTVSRWERGLDTPGVRMRRQIRDLARRSQAARQDQAVRMRVRNALWPTSLMGKGAVFLEASRAVVTEAQLSVPEVRGMSVYGSFGDQTDAVTERWEAAGIFRGDLALAMTVNVLNPTLPGQTTYIQTLDTPHFTVDGDIWCICEIKRIDEALYHSLVRDFGGNSLLVPFDAV